MTRLEAILEQMQQPETTLAESATLQLDEIDAQRAPRPDAAH